MARLQQDVMQAAADKAALKAQLEGEAGKVKRLLGRLEDTEASMDQSRKVSTHFLQQGQDVSELDEYTSIIPKAGRIVCLLAAVGGPEPCELLVMDGGRADGIHCMSAVPAGSAEPTGVMLLGCRRCWESTGQPSRGCSNAWMRSVQPCRNREPVTPRLLHRPSKGTGCQGNAK